MAINRKIVVGHSIDDVKDRTQIYNPVTGNYLIRDASTGKIIDVKSDGKAVKGLAKETQITHVGITISKDIAVKAEQAVIITFNNKHI